MRFLVPLKCKCSRKWAAPDVSSVSFLLPAPMNTPTADIGVGHVSVHTLIPFERVVTLNGLTYFNGSGISPKGSSPKFYIIGALENYNVCSFGVIW